MQFVSQFILLCHLYTFKRIKDVLKEINLCYVSCKEQLVLYNTKNECQLNCWKNPPEAEFSIYSTYDYRFIETKKETDSGIFEVAMPWSYQNKKFNYKLRTLSSSPNLVTVSATVESSNLKDNEIEQMFRGSPAIFVKGSVVILNSFNFFALNSLYDRFVRKHYPDFFTVKNSGLLYAVQGPVRRKFLPDFTFSPRTWKDKDYFVQTLPAEGRFLVNFGMISMVKNDNTNNYGVYLFADDDCGEELVPNYSLSYGDSFDTTFENRTELKKWLYKKLEDLPKYCGGNQWACAQTLTISAKEKVCLIVKNDNYVDDLYIALVLQMNKVIISDRKELKEIYDSMTPWMTEETIFYLRVVSSIVIVGLVFGMFILFKN